VYERYREALRSATLLLAEGGCSGRGGSRVGAERGDIARPTLNGRSIDLTGAPYPAMGQRFRLRANLDISGLAGGVILRALKKYGMFLADDGRPGTSWASNDVGTMIAERVAPVYGLDFSKPKMS
jgi:hypothetical protein